MIMKKMLQPMLITAILALLLINNSCANDTDDAPEVNYFENGKIALESNNFIKAIDDFTKAIEKDPDNNMAYYYRGLSNLYKMELEKAAIDFSKVINNDSTYPDAYNNRGLAYTLMGNMDMAIQDLDKAIELDSNFAQAYVNRGTVYTNWNNSKEALNDFNRALELDQNNPMAFYQLGMVYYRMKDYDEAESNFLKSINFGLIKEDLLYNLGNCYYYMKKFDKAVEYYTKVLEVNPQNTTVLNNRAVAYDKSGKKVLAAKDRETLKSMNIKVLDLPEEGSKIKYKTFVSTKGDISIELPENWHKTEMLENDLSAMLIANDSVTSIKDFFVVGVNMSLNKNMGEKYGVSEPIELIEFWKGSSGQNAMDYAVYDIFTQKLYKKGEWEILLNKVRVQVTPQMPILILYELVQTKKDVLFYAYFQAPESHFTFFEELYDKAINSVIVK